MRNVFCQKKQLHRRLYHHRTSDSLLFRDQDDKIKSQMRLLSKVSIPNIDATIIVATAKSSSIPITQHPFYTIESAFSSIIPKKRWSILEGSITNTTTISNLPTQSGLTRKHMFPQAVTEIALSSSMKSTCYPYFCSCRTYFTTKTVLASSDVLKEIDIDGLNYINECLKQNSDFATKTDDDINAIIHGMWKALKPIYGSHINVSQIQSFGASGIIDLAKAVQQEIIKSSRNSSSRSKKRTKVRFHIPHHRTEHILDWMIGQSILDVAKNNSHLLGEYMEGTCGGTMSCSTCHIYIYDPQVQQLLVPADESELDMLDLAYESIENISRLGCQIKLSDELYELSLRNGPITVTIPSGVNNVWHVNTWF